MNKIFFYFLIFLFFFSCGKKTGNIFPTPQQNESFQIFEGPDKDGGRIFIEVKYPKENKIIPFNTNRFSFTLSGFGLANPMTVFLSHPKTVLIWTGIPPGQKSLEIKALYDSVCVSHRLFPDLLIEPGKELKLKAILGISILEQGEIVPLTIRANIGDPVIFENYDIKKHKIVADDGSWTIGEIMPKESKSISFSSFGDFSYHCEDHPEEKGKVLIAPAITSLDTYSGGVNCKIYINGFYFQDDKGASSLHLGNNLIPQIFRWSMHQIIAKIPDGVVTGSNNVNVKGWGIIDSDPTRNYNVLPYKYIWRVGGLGGGGGKFNFPNGLALNPTGEFLYVADYRNNKIQKLKTSDGSFVKEWSSSYPFDCVCDSSENIYVTDIQNNKIYKYDSSGTLTATFGPSFTIGATTITISRPTGVMIDSSGRLCFCDNANRRIVRTDTAGAGIDYSAAYSYYPVFISQDGSGNYWMGSRGYNITSYNYSSTNYIMKVLPDLTSPTYYSIGRSWPNEVCIDSDELFVTARYYSGHYFAPYLGSANRFYKAKLTSPTSIIWEIPVFFDEGYFIDARKVIMDGSNIYFTDVYTNTITRLTKYP